MGNLPSDGSFAGPDRLLPVPPEFDACALPGSPASPYAPPAPDPDAPIRPWWVPVMKGMEFAARCAWVYLWLIGGMMLIALFTSGSGALAVALAVGFFFVGRYVWRLRRELRSPARRTP